MVKRLSKRDVAVDQLDAAVELWSRDFSPIAIHTLLASAVSVLDDLLKRERPKEHQAYRVAIPFENLRRIKKTASFLKHADNDHSATIRSMNMCIVEADLGFSIAHLRRHDFEYMTRRTTCFDLMMKCTWPEKFKIASDPDPDIEIGASIGAALLRSSIEERRRMYEALLNWGVIDAGMDLRRVE